MSFEQPRKKTVSLWLDLAIFAGAVLFCAFSFHALTRERLRSGPSSPLAGAESDRRPASNAGAAREDGGTAKVALPCLRSSPFPLSVSARLVQLQAGPCRISPGIPGGPWSGKNERTGEELQLFSGESGNLLVTNFFALKPGRNRLVFSRPGQGGHTRTEVIELNRTSTDEE